jgi:hypothetical protein
VNPDPALHETWIGVEPVKSSFQLLILFVDVLSFLLEHWICDAGIQAIADERSLAERTSAVPQHSR